MKLKALLAVCGLCMSVASFAADEKPTLKEGVDAGVKAAIEAALAANDAAKKVGGEWIWALPQRGMWEGDLVSNGAILDQAILKANEGKNDEAKAAASFIEMVAKEGVKQAELAKSAGPSF